MPDPEFVQQAPEALRSLASWQASRLATIGARLTAGRMPLEARSDFAVLTALAEFGELSQADLGRRLGLDRNNVNGVVTRLERSGAIERRPDPADRRRNVVALAPSGGRRLQELLALATEVQADLLRALDEQERGALRALLEKALAAHPALPA